MLAEIIVINFINITFIHVSLQKDVQHIFRGANTKLTKSPQELMFGDMLVTCNIEVLEHWLNMNSLDSNGFPVLIKNTVKHLLLLSSELQVLSSGEHSVINSDGGNLCLWIVLDAISSESGIDTGAEVFVIHHVLGVIWCFVFSSKCIVFFGREVEIKHRKNLLELGLGHFASSELVEI